MFCGSESAVLYLRACCKRPQLRGDVYDDEADLPGIIPVAEPTDSCAPGPISAVLPPQAGKVENETPLDKMTAINPADVSLAQAFGRSPSVQPKVSELPKSDSQKPLSLITERPSLNMSLRPRDAEGGDANGVPAGGTSPSSPSRKRTTTKPRQKTVMQFDSISDVAISGAMQINIDNPGKITTSYDIGKKLGEGSFGSVCLASVKATGAIRAVKSILKERVKQKFSVLRKEIEIGKMVDHPNIIKLYEIFEDKKSIHLVMEICTGGELFDRVGDGGMPESRAAVAMQQLMRAVCYLHNHKICHRDLKAQNILISGTGHALESSLRITDFGLSCTFAPNTMMTAVVGTASHMAPQVLEKSYDMACDLWSCGVILYHILSGRLPFGSGSREVVMARVRKAQFTFRREFVDRSDESMQLISSLLAYDVRVRCTTIQALAHPWMKKYLPKKQKGRLNQQIVNNLRSYRLLSKFKKASLSVIASMLTDDQIGSARDAFLELDLDGDGYVSVAEVRDVLELVPLTNPGSTVETECFNIFDREPVQLVSKYAKPALEDLHRRSSFIMDSRLPNFTYTEFIAATFDRDRCLSREVCLAAFRCFDKDGDGNLSREELISGRLLGKLQPEEIDLLLADLDDNCDGEVDFEEFMAMMTDAKGFAKCFSVDRSRSFF
mmetsp:Transcript_51321/g.111372  ORF Transcript_51321/g.111372 Transcript_51321/m.111372 type:complete len:666 (+) Transcript_51321:24-2021(+)